MKLADYLESTPVTHKSLATSLGVSPVMVSLWASGKRRVPAERCLDIERLTKGLVRCEDMRGDLDWAVVRSVPAQSAAA